MRIKPAVTYSGIIVLSYSLVHASICLLTNMHVFSMNLLRIHIHAGEMQKLESKNHGDREFGKKSATVIRQPSRQRKRCSTKASFYTEERFEVEDGTD